VAEMDEKKAGVPLWIWITGGAGLLAIAYFWYKNKSSSAAAANTTATNATGTTDTSGLATDQYEVLLSQIRDLQGQESSEPAPGSSTGSGVTATPIVGVGPLPVPTSPSPISTTPTPTPTPATANTVTTAAWPAWNSTLWGIAQKQYGDGSQYPKIFSANQNLIVGQEIAHGLSATDAQTKKYLYPGETLTIP